MDPKDKAALEDEIFRPTEITFLNEEINKCVADMLKDVPGAVQRSMDVERRREKLLFSAGTKIRGARGDGRLTVEGVTPASRGTPRAAGQGVRRPAEGGSAA